MPAPNNRMARGSGIYKCRTCGRGTRATGRGDNEHCGLCAECYDLGGEENHLSDNGKLYSGAEEVLALIADVAAKGGNAAHWDDLKAVAEAELAGGAGVAKAEAAAPVAEVKAEAADPVAEVLAGMRESLGRIEAEARGVTARLGLKVIRTSAGLFLVPRGKGFGVGGIVGAAMFTPDGATAQLIECDKVCPGSVAIDYREALDAEALELRRILASIEERAAAKRAA